MMGEDEQEYGHNQWKSKKNTHTEREREGGIRKRCSESSSSQEGEDGRWGKREGRRKEKEGYVLERVEEGDREE